MSGDTLGFDFTEQPEPPRRRRRWPWLVALVVVLVLMVAAFFAGEWVARDLIVAGVKQQISARLDVADDQEVDVEIPGLLLPQLAAGTLESVTVSADDLTVGEFTGDVTVVLRDIQPFAGPRMADGAATVSLDETQLRALLASGDAPVPVDSIALADPDITASTEFSILGFTLPLAVALTPSVDAGDLLLSPASLHIGANEVTADQLRSQVGGLADGVLDGWRICVADRLPAGLPLTGVTVDGGRLVVDLAVQGDILTDAALRQNGVC